MIALKNRPKKKSRANPGLFDQPAGDRPRPRGPHPFATPLRPGADEYEPFPVHGPLDFRNWLNVLIPRVIRRCLVRHPNDDTAREWMAKWFEREGCPVRAGVIREWLRHIQDSIALQTPTSPRFVRSARAKIDGVAFPPEAEHLFAGIGRRKGTQCPL